MNSEWQLQTAKNKLSEVVERAQTSGPQEITRRGKKTAVILSFSDYQHLIQKESSLVTFFQNSPLRDIELTRNRDLPRDIEL